MIETVIMSHVLSHIITARCDWPILTANNAGNEIAVVGFEMKE